MTGQQIIDKVRGEGRTVLTEIEAKELVKQAGINVVDTRLAASKEEAIEFLKETEKRGLVHNAIFDKGFESSNFFCNCCSCHCGALFPAKLFHDKGVYPSNYAPTFDIDLCTKCETCMRKCPKEAIYHIFPMETDSSDEKMVLREELCIGCGICEYKCPVEGESAIRVFTTSERDLKPYS